ncbi:hypothetical protein VTN02DRAFT_5704 [Thermoascus thermophilus]
MSYSTRYRSSSPGTKRFGDPMRASTGTLNACDPYSSPATRYAYDGYSSPRASETFRSTYDARIAVERKLDMQSIPSKAYRDPGNAAKSRTERPLSIVIPSSANRRSPVVASSYDSSANPLPARSTYLRDDPERYVLPASSIPSRHRRIYSTPGYSSDTGRLDPGDRAARARMDRGVYRLYSSSGRRTYQYHIPGGLRKSEDIDDNDAYSYTNAREQFEKDSAARLNSRRENQRKERPVSMTGLDGYLSPLAPRKEQRAGGPPPSQRGFEKVDREEKQQRGSHGRVDSDVPRYSTSSRQWPLQRTPVSLHQDADKDYSSYQEEYGDHRKAHRRHRRHDDDVGGRQRRDDWDSRKYGTSDPHTSGISGGLATAGLVSGYSKDAFDHDTAPKHERHRPHVDASHDRENITPRSKSGGVNSDDESKRHRRGPSRLRAESDSDGSSSDEDLLKYSREISTRRRTGDSGGSDTSLDEKLRKMNLDSPGRRRARSQSNARDDLPSNQSAAKKPAEVPEERQRKTVTVDPAPAKEPEAAPPKGILKPPRDKFPEDPNAVREGVAPLKDAQKKGIPPGARWTKIDRRLVNPAALEAGHERFEERPEYVIVLRVLTKEEIQAYAVKTQEIRDARYQAERQERRKRKEKWRYGHRDDNSSSDDEDEDNKTPLAIEAPQNK